MTQKTETTSQSKITIKKPARGRIIVRVDGLTSLIMHAFKNKEVLREKPKKGQKRPPRNPEKEFQDSLYRMPDNSGYAFPAVAFKGAMVAACREVELKMTEARQLFFVSGVEGKELVRIIAHEEPIMREDVVRLAQGQADLRYRPEFPQWSAEIQIEYNAEMIDAEDIINLLDRAGWSVGIGEWRPERKGGNTFGRFEVKEIIKSEIERHEK